MKKHKTVPSIKLTVLFFIKICGGFFLARYLTRKSLRILCYHGVSTNDQCHFNGLLFMQPETFRGRMKYLKEKNYSVLSLSEAIGLLSNNSLPPYPTVITADDGWHYTYTVTYPIAQEYNFPLTVYVTSYYANAGVSVLNVVLRYLVWKSENDFSTLPKSLLSEYPGLSFDNRSREDFLESLIEFTDDLPTLSERSSFVEKLADCLGFEGQVILADPVFRLMSLDEIRQASKEGIDIQLHTHRHRFPQDDISVIEKEIVENREVLEPLTEKKLSHLCYPSGVYMGEVFPTLNKLAIKTAVTCEPGFATKKTNLLSLPRFLDGENISSIEFEAEMCGVLEISRKIRRALKCFV